MKLTIACETTFAFDIRVLQDVSPQDEVGDDYLLEMTGGEWHLTRYPEGWWNLGHAKLHWTEALKRALTKIESELDEGVSAFEVAMGRKA